MSQENIDLASDLNKVQKQISTGKRIVNLSDEPWSIGQMHGLRNEKSVQKVFLSATNTAQALLSQADNALRDVMNVINRTKELAVQMSNDTYSDADLANAVAEISNLKERVLNLANAEFDGRYVFAGTAYDTVPFDATFAYAGSTTEMSLSVSANASVEVGFDGSDVFQGSVDVFTAYDDLITGLNNNDDTLINGALDDFEAVFDQMNNYQTRIGTEMNIASDMAELAQNIEIQVAERLSSIEDVDMADAMTRFSMLQAQYQINLQLTSKTRGMSLFERM
jgi:flagellar hook-associated protein 3 FlgL